MKCSNCGKKVFAKEICECGLKAPNPHGFGVALSSVIFFAIVFLTTVCLIATLSLRSLFNKNIIRNKIDDISLSAVEVNGQRLDEYISSNFIADERITAQNVDNLLSKPFVKEFINDKLDSYSDYCFDEGKMPEITADEVIKLIEDNEDLIYSEVGIRFLDADKDELRADLAPALDSYNTFRKEIGDSWYFSGAIHTFFSFWNVIFLTVLLAGVFINWLIVYKLNSRRASKMLIKYGIAVLIPSVLVLAGAVSMQFIGDLKELLGGFGWNNDIKMPFILFSAIFTAAGIFLILLSLILRGGKKTAAAENNASGNTIPVQEPQSPEPQPASQNAPIQETAKVPEEKIPGKCGQCGHQNRESASFCTKCGTKL